MSDGDSPRPDSRSQDRHAPGREAAPRAGRLHLRERLEQAKRTNRLLWIALAGVLALALVGAVAAGALLLSTRGEARQAGAALDEKTREASELQARLQKVQEDLDTLVRGRLPGVEPLHFDRVIPIEKGYVRNLLFTEIRRGGERRYEYKIVIENRSDALLTPNVRLSLFDRVGVQLGIAEIASTYSITKADLVTLSPREVRSFTAEIELNRPDAEPRYYELAVN